MHKLIYYIRRDLRKATDNIDQLEQFIGNAFQPDNAAADVVKLLNDAKLLLNQAETAALQLQSNGRF